MIDNFDENFYSEVWTSVKLTNDEIDALCDAIDTGNQAAAKSIIDGAYNRLFGETIN